MTRLSARLDGRVLCLVCSTLMLLLGLGLVGAGLAWAEASRNVVATKSVPLAAAVPLSTATAPLVDTNHIGSALGRQPGRSLTVAPERVKREPRETDPRVFLSKMATWRSGQRLTLPTALDPYQASLHLTISVGDFTTAAASANHALDGGRAERDILQAQPVRCACGHAFSPSIPPGLPETSALLAAKAS